MLNKITRLTLPAGRRILAVSDIHGQLGHLQGALKAARLAKDDILFIVGDIIEKGPDSLGVLRHVMRLCEEYTVYPLIGNVDAYQLKLIEEGSPTLLYGHIRHMRRHWGSCLLAEMCGELGLRVRTPLDLLRARPRLCSAFQKELAFLRGLPTIVETQRFIFVHGGLPTEDLSSLEGTDAYPCLKNDAFQEQGLHFSKYVVVGHWPVTLYNEQFDCSNPIVNREQRIISIDGGCSLKRTGQLNVLIIPSEDSEAFSFIGFDGFPVKRALDAQQASEQPFSIRYIDSRVRVLKREKEFSLVEHTRTGRRLWVMNANLLSTGRNARCDDCTDYHLPVSPGDKLSVLQETTRGYLVKKDGTTGWYCGRLAD